VIGGTFFLFVYLYITTIWIALRIKKYHVSLPQTSCTPILGDVTAFSEVNYTSQKFSVAHSLGNQTSEHKVTWRGHNLVIWIVLILVLKCLCTLSIFRLVLPTEEIYIICNSKTVIIITLFTVIIFIIRYVFVQSYYLLPKRRVFKKCTTTF